jgi:hypothetical protein
VLLSSLRDAMAKEDEPHPPRKSEHAFLAIPWWVLPPRGREMRHILPACAGVVVLVTAEVSESRRATLRRAADEVREVPAIPNPHQTHVQGWVDSGEEVDTFRLSQASQVA